MKYLFVLAVMTLASIALQHVDAVSASRGCENSLARYDVAVPGHPYAVAQSLDGRLAFVSINSSEPSSPTGLAVLRCVAGRYKFSSMLRLETSPTGMVMTHDGKLLVIADEGFVVFVDTAAAAAGKPAIVGTIKDADGDPEDNDPGSAYVNLTTDDSTAFVSDEQNRTITVIDLNKARRFGFNRKAIIGAVPVAHAPIALTFSQDGRYLFTTSEIARKASGWPASCRPEGSPPDAALQDPVGAIITIDVAKAQRAPEEAIVSTLPSDCSPVRMVLSPDGSTVWVTNRASNSLTAFATTKLIDGDLNSRVATIQVGSNPVAVAMTDDGRYVLVGNTNRFGPGGPSSGTVSVVDARSRRVVGNIGVGVFPREFSRGIGKTLFLANYRSNSITVFNTSRLQELIK